MYPLKFEPFLRPMIWGGEKIAAYKGVGILKLRMIFNICF